MAVISKRGDPLALESVAGGVATWTNLTIPQPSNVSFGQYGAIDAATWGDLHAAQYLANNGGEGVRYNTPNAPGPFIMGSYSREAYQNDIQNGRFVVSGDENLRSQINQATPLADQRYDEATQEHSRLLEAQDPNDEGYGFYAANADAQRQYEGIASMQSAYNASQIVSMPPAATTTNDQSDSGGSSYSGGTSYSPTQYYDDGSSLTTYDDGSTFGYDSSGETFSSPSTDGGYTE